MPQINILESPVLDGDASQMGRRLAKQIIDQCKNHQYLDRPFGIVSGGETTVKIDLSNPGKGGRSQELTISFALAMHEAGLSAPSKWAILSGGTDGRDGPTDAAGGIITASEGIDKRAAENALFSHTSYDYLKTHGQLLMVGPTGTNLGDLVIIMAE